MIDSRVIQEDLSRLSQQNVKIGYEGMPKDKTRHTFLTTGRTQGLLSLSL